MSFLLFNLSLVHRNRFVESTLFKSVLFKCTTNNKAKWLKLHKHIITHDTIRCNLIIFFLANIDNC